MTSLQRRPSPLILLSKSRLFIRTQRVLPRHALTGCACLLVCFSSLLVQRVSLVFRSATNVLLCKELFLSLHPGFWGSLPVFLAFHVDGSTSTLDTLSWHFRLLWWDIVEPMLTHLISKFLVGRLSL